MEISACSYAIYDDTNVEKNVISHNLTYIFRAFIVEV